jgi:S-layer protein (TIGR01564 family)
VRSINVKRVAAVATGAALVGAAAAAAVTTDSTGLESFPFYSGPEPNVKIVVGSASQASDGVNAANIAAMIGNLAYDSTEIEVLNTDMLSCGEGSGEGGSATCTAMVETPTVNTASAYLMKTYVEDRLDNNADTTRSTANAFNGPGNTANAKLVTQDHTNVLSMPNDGEVDNAKNLDIKQEQKLYLGAYTWYDSTTGYETTRAKEVRAIYETTFNNPLPACWDTTKIYDNCDTSSDQLDRTHTKINFLGDQWVVVSFTLSGGRFTNLKLGKEVAYNPVMNTGDEITAHNGVKVVLDGLSGFGYGTNTEPKATFLIYDENDVNIDTAILQPGDEYKGNGIFLHVYDATSTTGGADYVEISVFSDTLDLTHGNSVSGHGNWKAYLNGASGTAYSYGTTEALQSIMLFDDISTNELNAGESIDIITNSAGFKLNFLGLEEVDYDDLTFNLNKNAQITVASETYLTADMINIGSTRSNAFRFENDAVSSENLRVLTEWAAPARGVAANVTYGTIGMNETGTSAPTFLDGNAQTTGYYDAALDITCAGSGLDSGGKASFTVSYTDVSGTAKTAYLYFNNATGQPARTTGSFLNGITDITAITTTNTSTFGANCTVRSGYIRPGTAFYYKNSDSTNPYHVANTVNSTTANLSQYWYSTTESSMLWFWDKPGAAFYLGVPELTEDNAGLIAMNGTNRYWGLLYDQTLEQFTNAITTTTADKWIYEANEANPLGTTTAPNMAVPYTSYRGNKATSIGSSSATLSYAVKIAHGQYTLTSGESEGTGLEDERTAGVGEYLLDSDGYSVEVTQVGGENGGICELTGVENLEPSLDQAYEVAEIDASANPVVVLDSSSMASAGSRVIVGGPMVNSVAAEVLSGTTINPGDAMVKVVGSDVVVVGYSASDTTGAANALIDWLSDNRDNVVR